MDRQDRKRQDRQRKVIVELKCCESLLGEHQAQLINYLKASEIPLGLLINFGKRKLEYKKLFHPDYHIPKESHYS